MNEINKKKGVKKYAYTSGMTIHFFIDGHWGEGALISKCGKILTIKLLNPFRQYDKGITIDVNVDEVY